MKRYLTKAFSFMLVLTLVMGLMPAMRSFAAPADSTKHFKVNLFDYDQNTINQAIIDANPGAELSTLFSFYGGADGDPIKDSDRGDQSWYTGGGAGIFAGLAERDLGVNSPKYTTGINGMNLFDPSEQNRYRSYPAVDFPFTYQNGKYVYDSETQSASFNGTNAISIGSQDPNATKPDQGFWPFGDAGSIHFGMSMEVDFYVPADRQINGQDMVFNFSGDDDIWIYVDGKLVLDLGGIHDTYGGSINFTTGTITNASTVYKTYPGGPSLVDSLSTLFGSDFNTNAFAGNTVHKLKVFYLERGANESNCRIEFNIPQYEPLSVEKAIGSLNEGISFPATEDFEFRISTIKPDGDSYTAYNGDYNLVDKSGAVIGTGTSDSEGTFRLKAGQKAVFTGILIDTKFKIEELEKPGAAAAFDAETWMKQSENANITFENNVVTGTLKAGGQSDNFALTCTNNRKTMSFDLKKVASDTGSGLADANFSLTGETNISGEAVNVTATSNNEGIVTFKDIPIGSYEIKELSAPSGYKTDTATTYQAIVSMNGEGNLNVVFSGGKDGAVSQDGSVLIITNEKTGGGGGNPDSVVDIITPKIKTIANVPKTGDKANAGLSAILMALSLVGMGVTGLSLRKSRPRKIRQK